MIFMKYKQVTVKVSHDEAELASYAMIECGSEGASVVDSRDVREIIRSKSNWDYYDESLDKISDDHAFVTGCFGENSEIKPLADLLKSYLGREAELSVSLCDSADWENEWKKYYSPLDFGSIVVVPEWLDGKYDKPKILIDPGMAFGTGLHESTGMCIDLLTAVGADGKTVLDVGCGSGILGIASIALGAKECCFIDIDEQAVTATKSNLERNGMSARVICGDLAKDYDGSADVVLANLTADILLMLRCGLPKVTRVGSIIIMSGIINARADDVINGYTSGGMFEIIDRRAKGEWQAFAMRRKV